MHLLACHSINPPQEVHTVQWALSAVIPHSWYKYTLATFFSQSSISLMISFMPLFVHISLLVLSSSLLTPTMLFSFALWLTCSFDASEIAVFHDSQLRSITIRLLMLKAWIGCCIREKSLKSLKASYSILAQAYFPFEGAWPCWTSSMSYAS